LPGALQISLNIGEATHVPGTQLLKAAQAIRILKKVATNEAVTPGGLPEIERERAFTHRLGTFAQNLPGQADFFG
jgi:hypothetical protein